MTLFVSAIVPTVRTPHDLVPILTNLVATLPDGSEVVIVDDSGASADWSVALSAVIVANPRAIAIRAIANQENRGPGYSRNAGIAAARGRFVCFVDDDDAIVDGPFRALRAGDVDGCDIMLMGFHDTSGVMTADAVHAPLAGMGGFTPEHLIARYRDTGFLPLQCQAFLFDIEFLRRRGIRFPETYLAEDVTFDVLALLCAEKLTYIDTQYYVYNSRGGSLKSAAGLDRAYDFLLAAIHLADYLVWREGGMPVVRGDFLRVTVRRLISLFFIRLCQVADDARLALALATVAEGHGWFTHLPDDDDFRTRALDCLARLGGGARTNADLIESIVSSFRSAILARAAADANIYIYCAGPLGYFFTKAVFATVAPERMSLVDDNTASIAAVRSQDGRIIEGSELAAALKPGDIVVIANIQGWIADKIEEKLAAACEPDVWKTVALHRPEALFDALAELHAFVDELTSG